MALGPRFRRVAALDRPFVDREHLLASFEHELASDGEGPRVINLVGVGGIGKSRLLGELRKRASDHERRTAMLDLQVSAMRQQEDALAILRTQFGEQGIGFERFDIAYAVLWQRVHPNLDLGEADLPFRQNSELLTNILDDASGVPVFGTAVGLARLAGRARSRRKQRRLLEEDETLTRLDELSTAEVLDALTYLFAEDLREDSTDRPYTLFVDAYEALAPRQPSTGWASSADIWLRDLAAQLDRGITVIASREPLLWPSIEPAWEPIIRSYRVEGLPMQARLKLLTDGRTGDPAEWAAVAEASRGVPFYLHLAIDTQQQASGKAESVVSSDEILQRFLQHVDATEVRLLELLSVARSFDYEIFGAIARAFDLPGDRMRWESLTAYSFVYPADGEAVRLHQLMNEKLRDELPEPVAREVHAHLQDLWDQRAADHDGSAAAVGELRRALREACYHGVRAGRMPAAVVLDHADRALLRGGMQAADGILSDVKEFLDEHVDPALAEVARCLDAEAAVWTGDAALALELSPGEDDLNLSGVPGTRLAIAAAHARRVTGATAEAERIYGTVWDHARGPERHVAGFWVGDLHMCQGRLASAVAHVDIALAACPEDDIVHRADLTRLLHSVHRFNFDFTTSAEALELARAAYEEAGSVVRLANAGTQRVELLAWSDPPAALEAAPAVIESQRELGALRELGRAHTAVAIAQLQLGEHTESAESFRAACEHLERAGYRSGRARAELFRGVLHLRTGNATSAAESIGWAVDELVASNVYPTLILLAEHLLARSAHDEPRVGEAAKKARDALEPLDSVTELEQRIDRFVAALLDRRA